MSYVAWHGVCLSIGHAIVGRESAAISPLARVIKSFHTLFLCIGYSGIARLKAGFQSNSMEKFQMAKETKFAVNDQGAASYTLSPDMKVSFDLNSVFAGFAQMSEVTKAALIFAVKTASRNSTAGKVENAESLKEAFDSLKTRIKSWQNGVWASRRESDAEPRSSLLARALALVQGSEPDEAAQFINAMIEENLVENGIDPEAESDALSDEEKKTKRKVQADVRKQISADPGVAAALAKIKAEDAAAKLAAANEAAQKAGPSKFAK